MIAEKDFAGRQARGAREVQEDAYAFSEIVSPDGATEGVLIVIADGMGGHAAGERASELAVKNFIAAFHQTGGNPAKRLRNALGAANQSIVEELRHQPQWEGMGTTLLAVIVSRAGVEWLSVGDSPLYLWSNAKLTRLNEDHSLRPVLREMAEHGEIISAAKAESKNVLRAAAHG